MVTDSCSHGTRAQWCILDIKFQYLLTLFCTLSCQEMISADAAHIHHYPQRPAPLNNTNLLRPIQFACQLIKSSLNMNHVSFIHKKRRSCLSCLIMGSVFEEHHSSFLPPPPRRKANEAGNPGTSGLTPSEWHISWKFISHECCIRSRRRAVILSMSGSIQGGRQVLNCAAGWRETLPRAQQAITHIATSWDQKITMKKSATFLLLLREGRGLSASQPARNQGGLQWPFQTRAVPLCNRQLLQLSRRITVAPSAIPLLMKTHFTIKPGSVQSVVIFLHMQRHRSSFLISPPLPRVRHQPLSTLFTSLIRPFSNYHVCTIYVLM